MEKGPKNYLITGGAGFIGSHLLEKLLLDDNENSNFIIIDNLIRTNGLRNIEHILNSNDNLYRKDRIVFINADVSIVDFDKITYYCGYKQDTNLYHLAATRINRCSKFNKEGHQFISDGGFNIIDSFVKNTYLEGNKKIFFSSSASVYDTPKILPIGEDHLCYPKTIYGAGKFYTECLLKSYKTMYPDNFEYIINRFFSVYGERMDNEGSYTEVIFNWLNSIKRGKKDIIIYGNPYDKILDLVYVDDVVDAIIDTTDIGNNQIYNVSTGDGVTLIKLVEIIEDVTGVKLNRIIKEDKRTDIEIARVGNIQKLKNIGWKQNIKLEKGIEKTWEWILTER